MHGDPVEPHVQLIQKYAKEGLGKTGHHGVVEAMGVPRQELPSWDDIQIITAQLATPPQLDDVEVGTEVVVGPNAQKPLRLQIPLLVSDMSFGSLSEPAKIALARGAELAGTGIASGEGGMLADEQASNSRYFYELASARFGFSWDKVLKVQAFHFKGGQGAKTGTGGHLPGKKVVGKIALTRGLPEGRDAVSPARFPDWTEVSQIKAFADEVRDRTGGSRSVTSSPPSTSRRTSMPRSRSAAITSSSTAAAARPVPRLASSATIFPCRRSRRWRGRAGISTEANAGM